MSNSRKTILQEMGGELLELLRAEKQEAMDVPCNGEGRPHSHGEVDNARGLRIRALSVAITQLEDACMWMNRSFYTSKGEYLP